MNEQILTGLLNESQNKALSNRFDVERSIRGIWGPPGTGKTHVAAIEATKALIEYNQRILICAYQNSTVDNTLRFIIKQLIFNGWDPNAIQKTIKRTGNISRISDDMNPYFSRNSGELALAKIVGTTLHSSFSPLPRRLLQPDTFDRIIMDESGQVTPEQAWIPLPLLSNSKEATITIYGDDVQLSPISPDLFPEKGVLRSLRTTNLSSVDMLNTSYRLNSPGIEMTSETFYFGNLRAPSHVKSRRLSLNKTSNGYLGDAISPDNPLAYVGVDCVEEPDGLSFDNYQQAMVISDLCHEFIRCGVSPSQICVMSAYRAHVRSISAALEGTGIECSTVHRMLGGENDVIVLATTRSNSSRDLGFISQPELLNVATSRQLRKLVIVGDNGETFSEGCKVSKKIYDFINKHGTYIRLK
jgi:superfamily I DNA and/or RNA helicase